MDTQKTSPMRTLVLSVIAGVVFLAVGMKYLGGEESNDPDAGLQTYYERIAYLQGVSAIAGDIRSQYNNVRDGYVDRLAALTTIKTEPGPVDAFIDQQLREILEFYNLESVTVNVSENLDNPALYTAKVSFQSPSNVDPLSIFLQLGNPASGFRWEEFNLTADRREKQVDVNGILSTLVVEIGEG